MSTQTPNIGLTLPIGTEHVSRAIINQNMTKIDTAFGNMSRATMRTVAISVAVGDWTLDDDVYTAEFTTAYVTATSNEFATFDTASMKAYCADIIDVAKKSGGGGIVLTTDTIPTGTISGTLYVWDADDGKVTVIIEGTTVPIENGGTGASNLSGAKTNLGIEQCEQDIATINDHIASIDDKITEYSLTPYGLNVRANKLGNLVVMSIQGVTNSAITAWAVFATLPSGMRPVQQIDMAGTSMRVGTDGTVKSPSNVASGTTVNSYIVFVNA